ncbi:MAG: hypothetical protein AAF518_28225, partial [Spirochaetota bacterium]
MQEKRNQTTDYAFLSWGTDFVDNTREKKTIRLFNFIAIVLAIGAIPYIIIFFLLNKTFLAIIAIIFLIFHFSFPFLNKLGFILLTRA